MRKQPDFSKCFYDYFGSRPRKIRYEIRFGLADQLHDLAFIRALLHDARFRPETIRRRRGRLVIPMERDCWELPLVANEFHTARTTLTIEGVKRMEWSASTLTPPPGELWLYEMVVDERLFRQVDEFGFALFGSDWKLSFDLDVLEAEVRVQDQEVPHLSNSRSAT